MSLVWARWRSILICPRALGIDQKEEWKLLEGWPTNGLKSAMDDMSWPKVSLIVSNLNAKGLLKDCLQSISELDYPNYEIIVIDTGSTDGAPEMVTKEFPYARLFKEGTIGIGAAINKGLLASQGDIIAFLLNNDETFSRGWLRSLVNELCSTDERRIVGGVRVAYGTDDIVQSAGMRVRFQFHSGNEVFPYSGLHLKDIPKEPFEVDYVEILVFRRELLGLIGLCDEKFYIYLEDADYCERAKRVGYKILTIPKAVSYHRGGESLKTLGVESQYYVRRGEVRLFIKHYRIKWMMLSLIKWAGRTIIDISYCPLGRIRGNAGRLSSRESAELCRLLIKCIMWNLKNVDDHVRARLMMRSIRPCT